MDSFQVTTLDVPVERAVEEVEEALRAQGFDTMNRSALHQAAQRAGRELEPYVLIHALDTDRALRALDEEREAGMLLSAVVVVRQYGNGSLVQALDPPLLGLAGNDELRSLGEELAAAVRAALDQLGDGQRSPGDGDGGGAASDEGQASRSYSADAEQVERQLMHAISSQLSQNVDSSQLLELSKAYTAIASLRRAEEVELHLA